tara:strand:- start:744 stop:1040 length:297 start_codon:yes stop_codon:yes gene_type:complete
MAISMNEAAYIVIYPLLSLIRNACDRTMYFSKLLAALPGDQLVVWPIIPVKMMRQKCVQIFCESFARERGYQARIFVGRFTICMGAPRSGAISNRLRE